MLRLAIRNLLRRPARLTLTLAGLAVSVALSTSLLAFADGYQTNLRRDLDRAGVQLMLVPLGCPYDAGARALKGRALEASLPASVLPEVRRDPAVAIAAPMLIGAFPAPEQKRTDLWVGIDDSMRALKPWWQLKAGSRWFDGPDSALLGSEAAEAELRDAGDRLYSPQARRSYRVAGILEPTGTSDDNLFFLPLATAQQVFRQPGRLSAVAIRLVDPMALSGAAARFQKLPGVQVVTMTEMMGAYTNLLGSVRMMVAAIVLVALVISGLAIFNTMLASVLERTRELVVMRAIGASVGHVGLLVALEAAALALGGALLGISLTALTGGLIEAALRTQMPMAPDGRLLHVSPETALRCLLVALLAAGIAALYPAWRATRIAPAALPAE
jgi:putative ABC transport system permease protein